MVFALALLSIPWSEAAAAAAPTSEPPAARYRGGVVTAEDYREFLLAWGIPDEPARKLKALESIALAQFLETAAVSAGVDRDQAVMFALVQGERDLLVAALQRAVNDSVRISDEGIATALEREKAELVKPRKMRLRNLFKRVPPEATLADRREVRARVETLRQRLEAGEDFETLAYRESDSQTRFQGGLLGYVGPGLLQPEVERVAFALKEGELSPVIETGDGFTLLRCDGIKEGRVLSLEDARRMIRQGLWTRETEARWRELREELLVEAAPRYHLDEALAAGGDGQTVVEFQGGRVTLAELRWLSPTASEDLTRLPHETLTAQLEEQLFRMKAADRARREGLDATPGMRARARWSRARVLATAEIAQRVREQLVAPSENEMRARFEASREQYVKPAETDFSVILLELATETMRDRFQEAERLLGRLRSGEIDFEEAARRFSRHSSASAGGRIGWQAPAALAAFGPNVFRVIAELEPGQLSGLVQQDKSLWIVKLWGRRPERPLTYEEAAPRVQRELGSERVSELQGRLEEAARHDLHFRVP